MKTKFILIGAVFAVVITTAFVYTQNKGAVPETTSSQTTSSATLKVGDKEYTVDVIPNETVTGAMQKLSTNGSLTYTSQEYPGLGVFIDSINGQKNSSDNYWILYVNGTTTSTGASATIINPGDAVEWKYEKGY